MKKVFGVLWRYREHNFIWGYKYIKWKVWKCIHFTFEYILSRKINLAFFIPHYATKRTPEINSEIAFRLKKAASNHTVSKTFQKQGAHTTC